MSLPAFLLQLLLIVAESLIASYVGLRAWHHRPARLFILTIAALIVLNGMSLARAITADPWALELIADVNVVMQGAFLSGMLLMFAALFMPQWWEGQHPIFWIALPYLLSTALAAFDLFLNLGIFVSGMRTGAARGALPYIVTELGNAFLGLYVLGALVIVLFLVAAFIRVPGSRRVIAVLALTLLGVVGFVVIANLLGISGEINALVISLPLLGSLAYAVLSTDLLVPVRLAADIALRAMHDAVVVVNDEGKVLFSNPAATMLGVSEGCPLATTMLERGVSKEQVACISTQAIANEQSSYALEVAGRQLDLLVSPILNPAGRRQGTLLLGRDITEMARYTIQIEQERNRLAVAVEALEARERERDALAATVRTLTFPLIPVLPGVLVLPLVGSFDHTRMDELTTVLLSGIEREHAQLVLIDITGVPLLDTTGAQVLLQAVASARLLGARCILVGVRPEIAQALVSLGVDLGDLQTAATLQQAIQARFQFASLGSVRQNGHS